MTKIPLSERFKAKSKLTGSLVTRKKNSKRTKPPVAPESLPPKRKQKTTKKPSGTAIIRYAVQNKSQDKPLWAHQKKTICLYKKTNIIFDTSDPGTGKTRGHLEAFALRRRKNGKAALVLAPKTLLEPAWQEDAAEFVPDMSSTVAYAENREAAFKANVDIYITNTDAANWLAKQNSDFFKRFDTIIIDESSAFKHRTSARSKRLRSIISNFKYRALLTATPTSRTILEIWHQVFLLDSGKRLGDNYFKFRNIVCDSTNRGKFDEWTDKEGAEVAVAGLIKDISVRHLFNDCMDIPPNHTYRVKYHPSKALYDVYKEMKERTLMLYRDKKISAVNAAVLSSKLLQITSGAVYAEGSDPLILDNGRTEIILDLIEERKHSVVFFNWTHQKHQLIAESEKRGIQYAVIDGNTPNSTRAALVKQYQAGYFQTLFLHPKTGAHGLTLTKGTATIWASPIYLPDFLKQGLHRIWRGGQTLPTETILIEAVGTLEGHVYNILNKRNKKMKDLLGMLEN